VAKIGAVMPNSKAGNLRYPLFTAAIVVIDEDEFNKRVAEHEANRQRSKRIRELFDKPVG